MLIIAGGDDDRMRQIITEALTNANEPYTITDDESDIISTEQAIAILVYNANKVRTYLGRLERNTRKQEEATRRQEQHMENASMFLEPIAAYFENQLPDELSEFMPRENDLMARVNHVRLERRRRTRDAKRREREE